MTLRVDNLKQRHRKDFELGGRGFVLPKKVGWPNPLWSPHLLCHCMRVICKNYMLLDDSSTSGIAE